MYGLLTRTWWIVLARGAAAAAFGATLLAWSKLPAGIVALAFGAFAVADGTLGVVAAVHGTRRHAWSLMTESVAGVAIGVTVLGWPGVTTATVLTLLAAWCGIRGVAQLWSAWLLHAQCPRETTLAAAACSVLVACGLLVSHPAEAATAVERVAGATTLTAGALLLVLAARLWGWLHASRRIAQLVAAPPVQSGHQRAV